MDFLRALRTSSSRIVPDFIAPTTTCRFESFTLGEHLSSCSLRMKLVAHPRLLRLLRLRHKITRSLAHVNRRKYDEHLAFDPTSFRPVHRDWGRASRVEDKISATCGLGPRQRLLSSWRYGRTSIDDQENRSFGTCTTRQLQS
jgi:hypothetical protein